jgi:hypothetical protein
MNPPINDDSLARTAERYGTSLGDALLWSFGALLLRGKEPWVFDLGKTALLSREVKMNAMMSESKKPDDSEFSCMMRIIRHFVLA